MKSQNCFWSRATRVCLIGLATQSVNGQGQSVYFVGKTQAFTQSSSTSVVADPTQPFQFGANGPNAATLILPAGGTMPLPYSANDQIFEFQQFFATKTALDTAWPSGIYRMTGSGIPTLSFNLTTDAYPTGTPQVTSGTWSPAGVLVVDPGQTTTISLNTFTGYATSGLASHMSAEVNGVFDNVRLRNQIASQAVFGFTASSTPLTSITIPAGTLTNGRLYQGYVSWDAITTLDIANSAVAVFTKQLSYYIAAQSPGTTTPAPVITSQPANQTGLLGGSATFSVNFTVGGSNTGQVMMDWMFNGQIINADGTKYSTNNGLTVNNLTAADAGSYSVRLGNAGGFVTSASATLTITTAAAPTISSQPTAKTVSSGSTVVFSVSASGAPTPTYQWFKDGFIMPGSTSATLVIPGAATAAQGSYSVRVTNSQGTVPSNAATLSITTTTDPGRLINLSILTPLAVGETMTMGTVLGGSGTSGLKPLLARAAGPALGQLGINTFLPDPTMTLVKTSGGPNTTIASNNDWAGSTALSNAFASVGAFAYAAANSKDAALFQSGATALAPGNYTVQVSDAGSGSGTVIAELYDATPAGTFTSSTPRLVNVSVLKTIGTGASLTAGFYVGGSTAKTVLIRAIGPTLGQAPFNIGSAMADPQLTLFNSSQVVIAANNDWGGDQQIANMSNSVGAFALFNSATKDAVLLITLSPGSYTAQVSPVGTGGTAIVEVYEVP